MNDDEKELVKIGAEAAVRPFGDLLQRLFGGAVDEIGGMWQDSLRLRRVKRLSKIYRKVQMIVDTEKFEPRRLPEALSLPLLQAASLQEDESLQEKWAALLASAANPGQPLVPTAYVEILAQLTSREIYILDRLLREFLSKGRPHSLGSREEMEERRLQLNFLFSDDFSELEQNDPDSLVAYIDDLHRISENMQRLGLVKILYLDHFTGPPILAFTRMGLEFVETCTAPETKRVYASHKSSGKYGSTA